MTKSLSRKIAETAVTVTLLCVSAFISIPFFGVPLTFQLAAAAVCGLVLGSKRGVQAVAVYLLLGVTGLPVFSGFSGGAGHMLSPTFGYLLGFLPLAAVMGLEQKKPAGLLAQKTRLPGLSFLVFKTFLAVFICYAVGLPYQILIMQYYLNSAPAAVTAAITMAAVYFIKDLALVGVIIPLAKRIRRG